MKTGISCLLISACFLSISAVAQGPPPGATPGAPQAGRMQIDRDIEYSRVGDRSLKLDLYRREPSAAPSPIVVWIHAGGWSSGDKSPTPATALLNNGFAVASIEYRPEYRGKIPRPDA